MVTENGTIKLSTAMTAAMQKELTKPALISSLVAIILGAAGVAVFLVLEIVSIFTETEEGYFFMLIATAAVLGLGIALRALLLIAIKNIAALPRINEYEFFSGYFTIDQTVNGENVLHNKILNNQITKSKETKNYLFFYIGNVVYPVLKEGADEGELNTLRSVFRLPVKGATVSLSGGESELS